MSDSPVRPRAYSTTDAAKYLGISRHTLEAWRVQGRRPPSRRLGAGRVARGRGLLEVPDAWIGWREPGGGGRRRCRRRRAPPPLGTARAQKSLKRFMTSLVRRAVRG